MADEINDIEQRVAAVLDGLGVPYELQPIDPNFADTAAYCEHSGDRGGTDSPHSDEQDAELPCCLCDFWRIFHNRKLYHRIRGSRVAAPLVTE